MFSFKAVFKAVFENFAHTLTGGAPTLSSSISTDLGEGLIGDGLSEIQAKHPEVEIGSYPFLREGIQGTSLVVRHIDEGVIGIVLNELQLLISNYEGNILVDD